MPPSNADAFAFPIAGICRRVPQWSTSACSILEHARICANLQHTPATLAPSHHSQLGPARATLSSLQIQTRQTTCMNVTRRATIGSQIGAAQSALNPAATLLVARRLQITSTEKPHNWHDATRSLPRCEGRACGASPQGNCHERKRFNHETNAPQRERR